MTVIDMQHMFLLKIKTLDRTDIKDPFSYDIVALLNNAQEILTDELIMNKRYDLLRPVTESVTTTTVSSPAFDSSYATGINADGEGSQVNLRVVKLTTLAITANTVFRSYVRSQSEITRTYSPTIAGAINVQNEDIPKDIIGDFETNGTNFPIFTRPKAILEGDYLIVLGDYYTNISKVYSVVVRSPKILHLTTNSGVNVTTCELPVELHNLIVDKAVQIFGETVNINDLKKRSN